MKERITIIMTMLLLGVVLVFTNSSTVEAKSKLKKSTTVTVKTLNKSTVKKVDKAFRSAKVVKVKVKASSKKKARKTMTKLNVKLCEYTEIDVYCLETYNCKKQGSYYVFENKSATTKIYRENSAIYLTFDKINTKIAEKIHNIMLEQSQISGKSRRDITIAIKAKNKKEGLQKRNELFAKIGECNIYGFLPTYVSADRGYYDKDAGLYYDTFSEEDEKNYYYGMQLVQTLLDSRRITTAYQYKLL
jgi:RNA-binding protein YhbY